MDVFEAVVLGVVQGLTEFIPVSSSGHLVLTPWLMGWQHPGLAFDATLHLGTLLAVVVFFHRDLYALARAGLLSLARRSLADPNARIAWLILFGTIPGAVLGAVYGSWLEEAFSSPLLVGCLLICTSMILLTAERIGKMEGQASEISLLAVLIIGLAQALALFPGISRSGATIAAGVIVGLTRPEAARFSFLLAVPITAGAGVTQMLALLQNPVSELSLAAIGAALVAAFVSGYVAIGFLLRFLRERTLHVFAAYTGVAGISAIILSFVR